MHTVDMGINTVLYTFVPRTVNSWILLHCSHRHTQPRVICMHRKRYTGTIAEWGY